MSSEHEVLRKLRGMMRTQGFDALVAFSPDNVTYTAGFLVPSHATNRFRRTITILAGDSFAVQIVVTVEEKLARERSRFSDIRPYGQFDQEPADLLAEALKEAGVAEGRIAIELDYMPAKDYLRLSQLLPRVCFEECRKLYFDARMIKTDEEVAILRRVGELTDRVIGEVLAATKPGMSELDLGRMTVDRMVAGGSAELKYQIGSGPRSGITNCGTSGRRIELGDVLRIEILGNIDNYRSNVTRTAVVGAPTEEQKRIWRTLITARDRCKAMLRPGTGVAELYRTYVDACHEGGIEPTLQFLGHGIGQTIHEEPYLTTSRDIALAPNITFTMEPLYMMPGRMGFHVEDMYVITPGGFSPITGNITPNDSLIEVG
ncbi:MAG TPA: Xaa-Pro peptidase family protein [Stellaceae bacterium]|nr:Xaa-Pro peptidase family protein [Stellaceae bacterium]